MVLACGGCRIDDMSTEDRSCLFCRLVEDRAQLGEFGTVVAWADQFPVAESHLLIVPRRHCCDFFEMTSAERRDADKALVAMADTIRSSDDTVDGFNIGWNCGEAAGQTVMHAHAHLIPRRKGDVANPRGGVRGVISERQSY